MRQSLTDSERPILSNDSKTRASTRVSTYSTPSMAPTEQTSSSESTNDPRVVDVKNYTTSLERLENKRLVGQRYIVSAEKEGELSKLALAGKVERALDRRYSSQDAVFRPKKTISEKA